MSVDGKMDKSNMPSIELVTEGSGRTPNYLRFLKVQQAEDGLKSGRKQFVIWQKDKLKVLTDQFYFLALKLDECSPRHRQSYSIQKYIKKNKKIRKVKH